MKSMKKNKKLVTQVFTFGFGQAHGGCYHVIKAETKEKCRDLMFKKFSNKWSRQYNSLEDAGVYQFNLKEVK